MPRKPNLEQKLKEYEEWLAGLTDLDRMNFEALISLPTAQRVIADCPEGKYRDMAVFALALKQVGERLQKEETGDA